LVAFPLRLYLLIRLGRLVGWRTRAFFGRSLRFHTDKPPRSEAVGSQQDRK
jgi:hypothetical protein